jgi:hypothetical protein
MELLALGALPGASTRLAGVPGRPAEVAVGCGAPSLAASASATPVVAAMPAMVASRTPPLAVARWHCIDLRMRFGPVFMIV